MQGRHITEIIIHCSATPEGHNFTVEDIDRWHRAKGWKGCGYHYVIQLDGSVHIGRPENQIGAHCKGHNAHSIGVCYIGGLATNGTPMDTRTPAQRTALRQLISSLTTRHPHATIHGHNEFANKACPCFSVIREYADFNHNAQTHPTHAQGKTRNTKDGLIFCVLAWMLLCTLTLCSCQSTIRTVERSERNTHTQHTVSLAAIDSIMRASASATTLLIRDSTVIYHSPDSTHVFRDRSTLSTMQQHDTLRLTSLVHDTILLVIHDTTFLSSTTSGDSPPTPHSGTPTLSWWDSSLLALGRLTLLLLTVLLTCLVLRRRLTRTPPQ